VTVRVDHEASGAVGGPIRLGPLDLCEVTRCQKPKPAELLNGTPFDFAVTGRAQEPSLVIGFGITLPIPRARRCPDREAGE
jgi:hypothetical protein